MSERDPRIDPQVGDVLRKGCSTVTVCMVDDSGGFGFGFSFRGQPKDMPPMPNWDQPWRKPWREWAKDAEVVGSPEYPQGSVEDSRTSGVQIAALQKSIQEGR